MQIPDYPKALCRECPYAEGITMAGKSAVRCTYPNSDKYWRNRIIQSNVQKIRSASHRNGAEEKRYKHGDKAIKAQVELHRLR